MTDVGMSTGAVMTPMATMASLLAVPFRLNPDGTVASVVQGIDQANAEQIGVLLSTIQGERPMQPGFGIPDPAFNGIAAGVVAAQVARYGPNVTITSVTYEQVGPSETEMTVAFA